MSEQQYGALADQYARRYGVPPKLFRLLITAESGWNPGAVSGAGARGLTQVVPKWHPTANLSTPQGQLEYGARHLGSLLKKYGNPRDALSVYNSGRPWAQGQGIGETRAYVTKIVGQYGSGGAPTTDAGAASSPVPASFPSGHLDAKRLMGMLNATRQRVLAGEGPQANYAAELQKIVAGALPRAGAVASAQAVGMQANTAGATIGGLTMGGGPEAHGTRALGNWQSDNAYDLMGKAGQAVAAGVQGTVVKISGKPGGDPGFAGYGITVRTPQGDLFFKHLGSKNVKVGQRITPQTLIGTLDAVTAGGPHLHLGGTNRELLDRLAKLYTGKG